MPTIAPFSPVVLASQGGTLQAHILPYGLTVHRLLLLGTPPSPTRDLIVGPEDPASHHAHGRSFFGPVVGRFANRLPAGQSGIDTHKGGDDVAPGLTLNLPEWGGEGVCHHGGPEPAAADAAPAHVEAGTVPLQAGPFDRLVWTPLLKGQTQLFLDDDDEADGDGDTNTASSSAPSSASSSASPSSAIFAVRSPHGDNGFPGELLVEARFSIEDPPAHAPRPPSVPDLGAAQGTLCVEYRAKILRGSAPLTPLNLTQHWGFHLAAPGTQTIDEHQLRFLPPAGRTLSRLELDRRGVPTGGLLPCTDGDAHGWAAAGDATGMGKTFAHAMPQGGYDHFYAWGRSDSETAAETATATDTATDTHVVALLHATSTRTTLAFRTNQTGCQVYTANGQPPHPAPAAQSGGARKALHRSRGDEERGRAGAGNPTRSAAFLEFSHPHALPWHTALQEYVGQDALLRDGDVYANWCAIDVWQAD